jgi:hypothetical protein
MDVIRSSETLLTTYKLYDVTTEKTTNDEVLSTASKSIIVHKTAEITAVPISSSVSSATTGYGCKNPVLPLV